MMKNREVGNGWGTMGLDPAATMDRFIWPNDISERLRLERSRYVRRPDDAVLFVLAPAGFGKSHLLQAIAWDEWRIDRDNAVVVLKAQAWNRRQSSTVLAGLVDVDVLLVDDADDFLGKPALAKLVEKRALLQKRTIIAVRERKSILEVGLAAYFRPNTTITFNRLSARQVQRLIEQRALDCGLSLSKRVHRRLASYRYKDVIDVMRTTSEINDNAQSCLAR